MTDIPTEATGADELLAAALALQHHGQLDQAEGLCRRVLQADPGSVRAGGQLARLLERGGRLDEAEAAYRRVLEAHPGEPATATALGELLLSQGRYAEGFAFYEGRFGVTPQRAKPGLPYPEWRGEDLAGKRLLIWIEQGYGDQIQYARFAPVLKAMGAQVTLLCLQPLQRLFAASLGVDVIGASGQIEFPDPDYWTMAGSIAWRLGVKPETIPGAPYLKAPFPGPELPPGFKIGLMTTGNPGHPNDANRSLPGAEAARLAAMAPLVIDLDPLRTRAGDFADTASLVADLDLVVSVDTSVAHLAGAMGKPVWILLPEIGLDWRWLRARTDSPWYPTARLYRQSADARWGEVIDRVLADVAAQKDTADPYGSG